MKAKFAIAIPVLAAALWAAPAPAQEVPPAELEGAEELAREGVQRLIQALELLLMAIPQYDPPVLNENGDIIIRRRNPRHEGEPEPAPPADAEESLEPTETST